MEDLFKKSDRIADVILNISFIFVIIGTFIAFYLEIISYRI